METTPLPDLVARVREEVGKVIIGQDAIVDRTLAVILTRNHALL